MLTFNTLTSAKYFVKIVEIKCFVKLFDNVVMFHGE